MNTYAPGFAALMMCLTVQLTGQQLDVSSVNETAGEPVKLKGMVVETRKYSFRLDTGNQFLDIQVPNGLDLQFKLNKPFFDPVENTIRVQRDGLEGKDHRIILPLKTPAFVRVEFNHATHRNRVLSQTPWRLNNYVVSHVPFTDDPTETYLDGELVHQQGEKQFRLKTGDGEIHPIVLGRHNARVSGHTILDLKPGETRVEVTVRKVNDKMRAESIWFWPAKPVN